MSGSVTTTVVQHRKSVTEKLSSLKSESGDLILFSKHSALSVQSKQDFAMMDTARKKSKSKELISLRAPPPPAVARRNARERNRVKQVNDGFANLRQHIPNSIASTFESGRGGNKKLSKVETLRMAVEYIRSLEEILSDTNATSNHPTSSVYQSSTALEVRPSRNYPASLASPSSDDDNLSGNSTPPPLQYVKLTNGSDTTYHILPVHMLANNEHLRSLKFHSNLDLNLASKSAVVKFKNEQLSSDSNPHSPGIYSESSLSPRPESDIQAFVPVFNIDELSSSPPTIKLEEVSSETESSSEEMRILCRNLIMLQADTDGDLAKQLNVNELISW